MIRPTHILLLVAILLAAVALVFLTNPVVEPPSPNQTERLIESPEVEAAELEEVVLPLPGKGPLLINLEYIGDQNYHSPDYSGVLTGQVLDAYANPIAFARIEVVGGPQGGKFVISNKDGSYRFDGLLPGMHIFRISSSITAEIVRMQQVSHSTKRDWLIGQAIAVKFEIRDHKNKLLPGAKVQSDFGLREAISDEQGVAVLDRIPSGSRVVIDVFAEGHVATRHELNLYAANTTDIVKISPLEKGGRLAGRVKSWPGGDVPTVTVVPRAADSRSGMTAWEKFQDVRVDNNGYFSFDDLPTNQLLDVRISHAQGVCDPRGRAITAGKDAPTRCDFIVRSAKARVSGVVKDQSGQPIAGAEIELLAAEPMRVLAALYPSIGSQRLTARLPQPSQLRRVARTDSRGKFSVALGDHIQGTGSMLLNVTKKDMISAQHVVKTVGANISVVLKNQSGNSSLGFGRRLDNPLPAIDWQTSPATIQTSGARALRLNEGFYRIHVLREGKTIFREDKYWLSGDSKILL